MISILRAVLDVSELWEFNGVIFENLTKIILAARSGRGTGYPVRSGPGVKRVSRGK